LWRASPSRWRTDASCSTWQPLCEFALAAAATFETAMVFGQLASALVLIFGPQLVSTHRAIVHT